MKAIPILILAGVALTAPASSYAQVAGSSPLLAQANINDLPTNVRFRGESRHRANCPTGRSSACKTIAGTALGPTKCVHRSTDIRFLSSVFAKALSRAKAIFSDA